MTPLRREVALVLVVAVLCLGAWVRATLHATAPGAPVLLVYGPDAVPPGARVNLFAVAVRPDQRTRVPLDARLAGGAPIERDVARFVMPAAGCDPCGFRVTGTARGAPVDVTGQVRVLPATAPAPARNRLAFRKWQAELKDRTVKDLAGPPLYPVAGRARSSMPTELLVLEEDGVTRHPLAANAAGARAPDGRALRMDRSGLTVHAPLLASPGQPVQVEVQAAEAGPAYVDVFVDGRLRDVAAWTLAEGSSTHAFTLPADAREWFAVRVTDAPIGSARGPESVGFVRGAIAEDQAGVLRALAAGELAGAVDDPLLMRAASGEAAGPAVARALQTRLFMTAPERTRLSASGDAQLVLARERRDRAVRDWLWPFRAAALLLVVLLTRLAVLASRSAPADPDEGAGDADPEAVEVPRRPLSSLVWGSVAFITSLAILWVLDWALTFALVGVEA